MGFRFKKSFKIAPGVKVNFNKKSTGVTFGGKGFHYTMNSKGKRTTSVGLPGTGLSYTSTSGGKSSSRKKRSSSNSKSAANNYVGNTDNQIVTEKSSFFKEKKKPILIAAAILFFIIGIASCTGNDDTVTSDTGIKGFELSYKSETVDLNVGKTKRSYLTVNGNEDFSVDNISFISSDENIAKFSFDDKSSDHVYYIIEAVNPGTATLYVQTVDGIVKSDEITVTVTNGVKGISFYYDSLNINVGEEYDGHISIDGTTPNAEFIKFVSSDENVVTIEPKEETSLFYVYFTLKGVSEGTATIYAETADGSIKSEEITVTVEKETTTEEITERETQKPSGHMVYITPNGERYHLDPDCAGKNGYKVSIDNAGGRTPCKKCAQ